MILPTEFKFKYKTSGDIKDPEQSDFGKTKTYVWKITDIPPAKNEKWMPPEADTHINIKFAAEEYEIDNHSGSFRTWQEIGDWYNRLTENMYQLDAKVKQEVDSVLAGISSQEETIRRLYKYLQSKTRYVSIDIGIGIWQPYSAQSVYDNRYGDCKDLTTFFIGLLRY